MSIQFFTDHVTNTNIDIFITNFNLKHKSLLDYYKIISFRILEGQGEAHHEISIPFLIDTVVAFQQPTIPGKSHCCKILRRVSAFCVSTCTKRLSTVSLNANAAEHPLSIYPPAPIVLALAKLCLINLDSTTSVIYYIT